MEKTLAFYIEALGFKRAFSLLSEIGEKWIEYVMVPDGRFIEFFYPGNELEAFDAGAGYMRLCLEVDDCAAAVKELDAKGVAIRAPVSLGSDGNYQAWIRDPDGRDIELMQIRHESKQAQSRKGGI